MPPSKSSPTFQSISAIFYLFYLSLCIVLLYHLVLGDKAGRMAEYSKAYRKEAHSLNLRTSLAAKIAIVVVIFIFLIFLRYLIF